MCLILWAVYLDAANHVAEEQAALFYCRCSRIIGNGEEGAIFADFWPDGELLSAAAAY